MQLKHFFISLYVRRVSKKPITFFDGNFPKRVDVFARLNKFNLYYNCKKYKLEKSEYWYLAPSISDWKSVSHPHPLHLAMLLHNTKCFKGITPMMSDLQEGQPLKTLKSNNAKLAEELLEKVRQDKFPQKPSRLRCHFLNINREVALDRQKRWFKDRRLERCYIVSTTGPTHYADVEIFEKLCINPHDKNLAEQYWKTFTPMTTNEKFRLEILVDSNLYFPDWQTFPELKMQDLAELNKLLKKSP